MQATQIQRLAAAVGQGDVQRRVRFDRLAGLTLTRVLFAVKDVGARDLLFTGAHQGQLDLILDLFDMQGAAGGHAALEGGGDGLSQLVHGLVNTAGCGGLAAFNGKESFGNGDLDLVVGVSNKLAIALDHTHLAGGGHLQFRIRIALGSAALMRIGGRRSGRHGGLHG